MPKTVTQEFKDAFAEKVGKEVILEVRYRRRFFNGSAFVFEVEQTILRENEIGEIGEIQWNLDIPFNNKFTASNVSLFLKNTQNEWIPTQVSPSIFAKDTVAPSGYVPELMEFQILWGYKLADGTIESVALFTGVATEYIFGGKSPDVEIVVTGRDHLLLSSEAAQVSDAITDEPLVAEPGDTTGKRFNTTSTGVGRIFDDGVKLDGIAQTQGADYEVEDLDLFGQPAVIEFSSAPPGPSVKTVSGLKWKTNEKIEDLVGLLMDEAGILPGERNIEPVSFPAGIGGSRTWDTKADWDGGTVPPTLDTDTVVGSLLLDHGFFDDFSDGNFLTPPRTWVVEGLDPSWSVSGERLSHAGTFVGNMISTSSIQTVGFWECKIQRTNNVRDAFWFFMGDIGNINSITGYGIRIRNSVVGTSVQFLRLTGGTQTILASALNTDTAQHTYKITRDSSGNFEVFRDTVSLFTLNDTIHSASAIMGFSDLGNAGTSNFDEIVRSTDYVTTGVWESDVHDTGVGNPVSYGALDRFETLNGGTITYETRTSDDGLSFDAYVSIGAGGEILSTTRRFIQVRATLTESAEAIDKSSATPNLERLVLNFTVGNIVVALANHEGETVFSMIEIYARLADYEFGFLGDGIAFFRSKIISSSPLVTLTQEDGIVDIEEYRLGLEEVRTVGQVKYGPYFNEFDGADAGEVSPTSEERFGRIIEFEDLGNILLANDVNLAAARARSIYETRRLPRKLLTVKAKMIPHLDLSDKVRISFFDNPLLEKTIFGDPAQEWGGQTPAFGDAQNVLARNLDFKAVGIRYQPEGIKCTLILQEVLS